MIWLGLSTRHRHSSRLENECDRTTISSIGGHHTSKDGIILGPNLHTCMCIHTFSSCVIRDNGYGIIQNNNRGIITNTSRPLEMRSATVDQPLVAQISLWTYYNLKQVNENMIDVVRHVDYCQPSNCGSV